MFKKIAAAILAIALIVAMWIVPSKASTFSDSLFFNADFNGGNFDDIAGNVTGEETYYGDVTQAEFVQDETIGRKVLRFHGESALFYTDFDYTKIQSNFTMEVYVKVPNKQSGWGYIAGTYWNTNPNAGICLTYGAMSTAGLGASMKYNVIEGNGSTSQTTFTGARVLGEWIHLVYVHDGVNEYYYENGTQVGSQSAWTSNIPSVTDDVNKAFRIGGYNRVSQFCANMDCAYVRVYSSAAQAADVAALYENRNNDAPTPTEAQPTPTEEQPTPTEEQPTPTEPQPTPDFPDFPIGSAYMVVAEDVPAFKAGDQVDITFKITDIEDPEGLLGVDLDIVYDYTLLKPLKNDNGRAIVKSSASEIMSKYENSKWTGTSRLDGEDTEMPTYELHLFSDAEVDSEEPQVDVAIKEDGELWFTISFEALADGEPDTLLAYTASADGTDSNVEGVQGTGTFAFVAAQEEPSEEPSDEPTEVPTEPSATTPVPDDDKPGNTVTFDAGLISLAAVALSSVVAVKKKRF